MVNSKAAAIFTSVETQADQIFVTTDDVRAANNLFNQAVQEGWNTELDWLWLATKVTLDSQRFYCLKQALHINPQCELAKRALKFLEKHPGQPVNFA